MNEKRKIVVKRDSLLIEKPTGNYSCPNYIPPEEAAKILKELGLEYTEEAKKKFAEVIENFGIEIARSLNRKKVVNKDDIEDAVMNMEII